MVLKNRLKQSRPQKLLCYSGIIKNGDLLLTNMTETNIIISCVTLK